jgi:tRNA threonylcarbamoyladenosine biosynthesis protein TsaB
MLSLRDLLLAHSSVLLVDSASARIQVGLLRRGAAPAWAHSAEEAGVGVFACTQDVLRAASLRLDQVAAFVFCDGPGSVLGIRTAAVALRTWNTLKPRPSFAYCSLDLAAKFQCQSAPSGLSASFNVIADARRDTWHRVVVDPEGQVGPLQRVPAGELNGSLLTPEHFRSWSRPPAGLQTIPYSVEDMLRRLEGTPLLREAPEPDAFLHEEPAYQTWTPQIHRAPSPK